jgi:acetyltransferase EpsM
MKKKVIILGASGASLDILSIIEDINSEQKNKIEFLGFLEDNKKKISKRVQKYFLGKFNSLYFKSKDTYLVTAFGNETNYLRKPEIIKKLNVPRNKYLNIIHPTCIISKYAKIGLGNVFHAYVTIARDVSIADQVVILPKTTISHDTKIGSYNIINTNCIVSGNVTIEENCYLGAGSNIRDHVKIKSKTLLGMSSVVTKNILHKGIYFGNPSKLYKKN